MASRASGLAWLRRPSARPAAAGGGWRRERPGRRPLGRRSLPPPLHPTPASVALRSARTSHGARGGAGREARGRVSRCAGRGRGSARTRVRPGGSPHRALGERAGGGGGGGRGRARGADALRRAGGDALQARGSKPGCVAPPCRAQRCLRSGGGQAGRPADAIQAAARGCGARVLRRQGGRTRCACGAAVRAARHARRERDTHSVFAARRGVRAWGSDRGWQRAHLAAGEWHQGGGARRRAPRHLCGRPGWRGQVELRPRTSCVALRIGWRALDLRGLRGPLRSEGHSRPA